MWCRCVTLRSRCLELRDMRITRMCDSVNHIGDSFDQGLPNEFAWAWDRIWPMTSLNRLDQTSGVMTLNRNPVYISWQQWNVNTYYSILKKQCCSVWAKGIQDPQCDGFNIHGTNYRHFLTFLHLRDSSNLSYYCTKIPLTLLNPVPPTPQAISLGNPENLHLIPHSTH